MFDLCPDPDDDPPRHHRPSRKRCRWLGDTLAPLSEPVRRQVYAALSATRHRQGPLDDQHRSLVLAAVSRVAADLDRRLPGHPQVQVLKDIRWRLQEDLSDWEVVRGA